MLDVKMMQQPKVLYSLEIHKAGSIFLQMYTLAINIKSLPVFLNIKLLKQTKLNSYCTSKNKRTRFLWTDSSLKVCKEYKVTDLGKPVEFLVIVMYAKESIRLMNFKQNSYFVERRGNVGKSKSTWFLPKGKLWEYRVFSSWDVYVYVRFTSYRICYEIVR